MPKMSNRYSPFMLTVVVSGVSRPIIRRHNRMYTTIGTYYSFFMTVCCPGLDNRQSSKNNNKYQFLYILLYLLIMGLETPETCRGSRNILRICCASSWVFFTQWYEEVCCFLWIKEGVSLLSRERSLYISSTNIFHYLIFVWPCIIDINNIDIQLDATITAY